MINQFLFSGSAMKTAFKVLNADELAETGSRGGMDVAVTAQPADSAKPGMSLFSDNSSSSFEDLVGAQNRSDEYDCNTQMFNFDLNAMKVSSTPYEKRSMVTQLTEEELGASKKQLFAEPKALSTIWEETKSGYW